MDCLGFVIKCCTSGWLPTFPPPPPTHSSPAAHPLPGNAANIDRLVITYRLEVISLPHRAATARDAVPQTKSLDHQGVCCVFDLQ